MGKPQGQDAFENALGGGVLVADEIDHLPVAIDGDAFGDEIFLDHVAQVGAFLVFGMRALGQGVRIEIRFAAQLHDALGQLVRVFLFLLRVLQELALHCVGKHALGHEVVAVVAQRAHVFGGKRGIEQLDHLLAIGVVALGDGAVFDALARAGAQGGSVGDTGGSVGGWLIRHGWPSSFWVDGRKGYSIRQVLQHVIGCRDFEFAGFFNKQRLDHRVVCIQRVAARAQAHARPAGVDFKAQGARQFGVAVG